MSINNTPSWVDANETEKLVELCNGTFTSQAFNSAMRLDPGSQDAIYKRRGLVDNIIANNACAPRSIVEAIITKVEAMNPELHEDMESYLVAYDKLHRTLLRYRNTLASAGKIELSLDPFSPILFIEEDVHETENIDLESLSPVDRLEALKRMQEQAKREIAMQDIAHVNKILGLIKKQHERRLREHLIINEDIDTDSLPENLKSYIITGSETGGETNRDAYLWNGFQCKTKKQKAFMDYMFNNGGAVNRSDAFEYIYREPFTPEKAGLFSAVLKPFREHNLIDVGWRQGVITLQDSESVDTTSLLNFHAPSGVSEEAEEQYEEAGEAPEEKVVESTSEDLGLSDKDAHVWSQLQKQNAPLPAARINVLFPGSPTLPEAMKAFPEVMKRINAALESAGDNRRVVQENALTKIEA